MNFKVSALFLLMCVSACGNATDLAFSAHPKNAFVNEQLEPVVVKLRDSRGRSATGAKTKVTLELVSENPATLSGTLTVDTSGSNATFSDLAVDTAGKGFQLKATAPGFAEVLSEPFATAAEGTPSRRLTFLVPPSNGVERTGLWPIVSAAIVDPWGVPSCSEADPTCTSYFSLQVALWDNPAGARLTGQMVSQTRQEPVTFNGLTIDRPGDGFTLVLAANGVDPVVSQPFSITKAPWNVVLVPTDGVAIRGGLTPSPVTPGTVFGGLDFASGMLLKTNDSFAHAGSMPNDLPMSASHVNVVVIDPRNASVMYVGTGDRIFKSTTGGATWVPANTGLPVGDVSHLLLAADAPDTLLAQAADAFWYKSTNGAQSWVPITRFPQNGNGSLTLKPGDSNVIYARVLSDGVYKSTDGGSTWSRSNNMLTAVPDRLIIDPHHPDTLYAMARPDLPLGGNFVTTNGGGTWSKFSGEHVPMYFDPASATTIYSVETGRIFKSTDSGASWRIVDQGINDVIGEFVIEPADSMRIYAISYYAYPFDTVFATTTAAETVSR